MDDKTYIEHLYSAYMPWMRLRAHRYVSDLSTCEDIAHDCLVKLLKHLEKLKALPEGELRAYIAVSIDNTAKNHIKRESKCLYAADSASADFAFVADVDNVKEEIDRKSDYETLRENFDRLCERDKDILSMKYDLELDDQQIADVLQIKKDSVRMTVRRSVKNLLKVYVTQEEKEESK